MAPIRAHRYSPLEWTAILVAALGTLSLFAAPLVTRHFRAMYADFGGPPLITALATAPYLPPAVALITLWLLVTGLGSEEASDRRVRVWGAAGLAVATLVFVAVAMVWPLFEVSEAVRAS